MGEKMGQKHPRLLYPLRKAGQSPWTVLQLMSPDRSPHCPCCTGDDHRRHGLQSTASRVEPLVTGSAALTASSGDKCCYLSRGTWWLNVEPWKGRVNADSRDVLKVDLDFPMEETWGVR